MHFNKIQELVYGLKHSQRKKYPDFCASPQWYGFNFVPKLKKIKLNHTKISDLS